MSVETKGPTVIKSKSEKKKKRYFKNTPENVTIPNCPK